MNVLPLVFVLPVLIAAGITDLKQLRIPNILVLLALALFCLTCPVLPTAEIQARILAALVVFAIGFGLFHFGIWGGGDAKLLAVLMLFIPSESLDRFAYILSAAMLFGTLAIVAFRQIGLEKQSDWIGAHADGRFPMGISIAMAGIAHAVALTVFW